MESLVQKYDRLRKEAGENYPENVSKFTANKLAEEKFKYERLTVYERNVKIQLETERILSEYKEKEKKYYDIIREIDNNWKKDLFEEFDVTDNPKAEKCYSIAYEHGHSYGYNDIYCYFSEIVELIY